MATTEHLMKANEHGPLNVALNSGVMGRGSRQ